MPFRFRITRERLYVAISALVLAAVAVIQAYLGSDSHMQNADQLVNPYMFESQKTFNQAVFPGQHSFFLKWPFFWLIALLHFHASAYIAMAILFMVATVAALAYLLIRIERRQYVIGTVFLALAAILALIPAQPYPGGLLPVNMAMLTTRNVEYAVYAAGLFLCLRGGRLKNPSFIAGTGLLSALFLTDKLFLTMSAGGALIAILLYAWRQQWRVVTASMNWLSATLIAAVVAQGVELMLGALHITRISHSAAGPYGLVSSGKTLATGSFYALNSILTNLGANPADQVTTLRAIPHALTSQLLKPTGIAYVINLVLAVFVLAIFVRFLWQSLATTKFLPKYRRTEVVYLSLALAWSAVAQLVLFVATKHDYVVDARYLTIWLFAITIVAVCWLSRAQLKPRLLYAAGALFTISIAAGLVTSFHQHNQQIAAERPIVERNNAVMTALKYHKTGVLIGDYWRLEPIRQASRQQVRTLPLQTCTTNRDILTSRAWQPDLKRTSFAYLISYDRSVTDYPACSYDQVRQKYGNPDSSVLISGTIAHPAEQILFYDDGLTAQKTSEQSHATTAVSALPTSLQALPDKLCDGPTTLNIVAHQDDDLLFMNPDILRDIRSGYCERTIYLTAGDAGRDQSYWLFRELGSEAAYSRMTGSASAWVQQAIELGAGRYVSIAHPKDNPRVTLIFFRLPDGDFMGDGFTASNHMTLAELDRGTIPEIRSVDNQSSFTKETLTDDLEQFIEAYQPSLVRTQSEINGHRFGDHSDHHSASRFATYAYDQYVQSQYGDAPNTELTHYVGYPIREKPVNVTGADASDKLSIFLSYAHYDGSVCRSAAICKKSSTYGSYLKRQYRFDR